MGGIALGEALVGLAAVFLLGRIETSLRVVGADLGIAVCYLACGIVSSNLRLPNARVC